MLSWDKSADHTVLIQLNAEVLEAQLELLSAHCATNRIRLRFSIEDVARHGQRDVLQKAFVAASELQGYYSAVEKQILDSRAGSELQAVRLDEGQVSAAITCVTSYIREQRERYLPSAHPLSATQQHLMEPFFSGSILRAVRMVEVAGRVPNPPFYNDAKVLGLVNLPDLTRMASLTFEDVLVFNDRIAERLLFHALTRAVQFQVLGLRHYVDSFVRSFLKTQSHFNVPLEAHAFTLEYKFAEDPTRRFSVEEEVSQWANQKRY